MITKRQEEILKQIIELFVKLGKPISSQLLINNNDWAISSASIRKEMTTLEQLDLITKPYNQAGRIPTTIGYEYYVDNLMNKNEITLKNEIKNAFEKRDKSINSTLQKASEVISELTNLTTVIIPPESKNQFLSSINITLCPKQMVNIVLVTSKGLTQSHNYILNSDQEVKDFITLIKIVEKRLVDTPIDGLAKIFKSLKPILAFQIKNLEYLFQTFVLELLALNNINLVQSGSLNLVKYDEIDSEVKEKLLNLIQNHSSFKQFVKEQDRIIKISEDGSAIIKHQYKIGGEKGEIAVIGSSRIEYEKVNGIIKQVVKEIEKKFID